MTHEARLPQCEQFQCEMKQTITDHIRESVPVRSNVDKHNEQILTLNKAHEAVMADIKDIKDEQKLIRNDILGIKIWLLGGVLSLAVIFAIPMFQLSAMTGEMKEKINRLEMLHPFGSPVSPTYGK